MKKILTTCVLTLASSVQCASCDSDVQQEAKPTIADIKAAIRCLTAENKVLRESLAARPIPVAPAVPEGAVIPFKALTCPAGWIRYERAVGKFVLGSGRSISREYAVEEAGGQSQVTLSIEQLPNHQHDTMLAIIPGTSQFGQGSNRPSIWGARDAPQVTALTSAVGGGSPISIVPPFVALLYCEKR